MQLQLGKKTIDEIESLIETNCWKALFWIHSLILRQLKYLFYYKNRVKNREHQQKWKKVEKCLYYMSTAIDICYSRSLIDEEFNDLTRFNSFRNKRVGHPDIYQYLPDDSEVKKMCKLGLKIVKKLDKKIKDALFEGNDPANKV